MCVINNLVAGIDGEVVFSTFGSQIAVCVAVICEPAIKRESCGVTPSSSDSLVVAEAVGCVRVNKHNWCSGFAVFSSNSSRFFF